MSPLSFYRQMRVDGGVRTGVTLGGTTVLSCFEEGEADHDPGLLWYVDLRCEGMNLPSTPGQAREWLLRNAIIIKEGFTCLSERLAAGVDAGDYRPFQWDKFRNVPEGVSMKIVCSAVRRFEALNLADALGDIGMHWEDRLAELELVEGVFA